MAEAEQNATSYGASTALVMALEGKLIQVRAFPCLYLILCVCGA